MSAPDQPHDEKSSSPQTKKTLTRRERKRLAKRNHMLDTAMSIIVKGGLESLTIARLADKLDAAVGALYRYFPGKQALIAALQFRSIEHFEEVLRHDLEQVESYVGQTSSPAALQQGVLFRLIAAGYSYIFDARRHPTRHRLMDILLSAPDPVLDDDDARKVDVILQRVLRQVAELFVEAAGVGALAPAVMTAPPAPDASPRLSGGNAMPASSLPLSAWQRTYVMWSHLHGLDHFRKRDRIQPPVFQVEALFRAGMRTLLQGWGATEDNLHGAFALFEDFLPEWLQHT